MKQISIQKIREVLVSKQVKSTLWALVGLAGPTGLQLIYIVVAARLLGAEETASLFLIVSVALISSAFVGIGSGGLVMRDISRDGSTAPDTFGRALAMSFVTFPILLPVVMFGAWFVTKGAVEWWVILLIGSSDLLAQRVLTTSWSLFIAREEQVRGSLMICTMPLFRLFAMAATYFFPDDIRFEVFAVMYFIVSFSVMSASVIYVGSRVGKPRFSLKGFNFKDGFSFSMTWLNAALQTESDKLLLGLFASPTMVAVYGVASRLMDGAAMPPRALRVSVQAKLFREGAKGPLGTYKMSLKILPITIVYGLAVWFGFWLLAPVIAWVFGLEFELLTKVIPVLGALPLLRAISDFGAEIFQASDRPSVQALTQTFATVMRLVFGVLLINAFGLNGAIATSLSVTALSGAILWYLAWRVTRPAK